jgi:opacity protein-like surface antigen
MKLNQQRRTPRLLVVAAAAVAAFALATPSSAQAIRPATSPGPLETAHWSITPFLPVSFAGDLDGGTAGIGVDAGYNWNSRVSFEGEFLTLPSANEGVLVNVDASTWNMTGNVLYHFAQTTEHQLIPFGVIGLGVGHGWTDLSASDPQLVALGLSDSSTNFVMNFGGGVKHRLNDRASLRGDLRYYTGSDLVPDFLRASIGVGFDLGAR